MLIEVNGDWRLGSEILEEGYAEIESNLMKMWGSAEEEEEKGKKMRRITVKTQRW